jgi:hypothetical protein
MIAPTMDAVAAILSAVNRYGIEPAGGACDRSANAGRVRAHQLERRGSGARRPRIIAIVTGKNVR